MSACRMNLFLALLPLPALQQDGPSVQTSVGDTQASESAACPECDGAGRVRTTCGWCEGGGQVLCAGCMECEYPAEVERRQIAAMAANRAARESAVLGVPPH